MTGLDALVEAALSSSHVQLRGLMCMAPQKASDTVIGEVFQACHAAFRRIYKRTNWELILTRYRWVCRKIIHWPLSMALPRYVLVQRFMFSQAQNWCHFFHVVAQHLSPYPSNAMIEPLHSC